MTTRTIAPDETDGGVPSLDQRNHGHYFVMSDGSRAFFYAGYKYRTRTASGSWSAQKTIPPIGIGFNTILTRGPGDVLYLLGTGGNQIETCRLTFNSGTGDFTVTHEYFHHSAPNDMNDVPIGIYYDATNDLVHSAWAFGNTNRSTTGSGMDALSGSALSFQYGITGIGSPGARGHSVGDGSATFWLLRSNGANYGHYGTQILCTKYVAGVSSYTQTVENPPALSGAGSADLCAVWDGAQIVLVAYEAVSDSPTAYTKLRETRRTAASTWTSWVDIATGLSITPPNTGANFFDTYSSVGPTIFRPIGTTNLLMTYGGPVNYVRRLGIGGSWGAGGTLSGSIPQITNDDRYAGPGQATTVYSLSGNITEDDSLTVPGPVIIGD